MDSDRDNFEVSGGDDEELIDFELIQNKQPSRGQKLLYYCKRRDSWQIITLTSNVNKHYLSSGWFYNFRFTDGSVGGNYLNINQLYWGLLSENQSEQLNLHLIAPFLNQANVDQVDGGITPESLSPEESLNNSAAVLDVEINSREKEEIHQHLKSQGIQSLHSSSENPFCTQDNYIDENLSDQGRIFGETAEEYLVQNLLRSAYQPPSTNEEFKDDSVQAKYLTEIYNLEVPNQAWSCYPLLAYQEQIAPGQKYRLPRILIREVLCDQINSTSAPDVRNVGNISIDDPEREHSPSRWRRGMNFFLGFVGRLQNLRRRK